MMIENGHGGNTDDLRRESRLTRLETGMVHLVERIEDIEEQQAARFLRERGRDQAISSIKETLKGYYRESERLARQIDRMEADQKRFLIGIALALGGIIWGAVRLKVGL